MRKAVLMSIVLMIFLGGSPALMSSEAESGEKVPLPDSPHRVLAEASWVDLTHPFDEETIYWPTANGFELTQGHAGHTDAGFYYAANDFAGAEHGGTHIDSPVHFYETGETVDKIPLERLIGEGVLVDVSEACAADPDYLITVEDLRKWETEQGRTLTDTLVLFRTGWGDHWPDPERYLGTAERGSEAVSQLRFPGLDPEAARWLATERSIRAVGIDTASIDRGKSVLFESHVALFERDIPAFENVASLDALPEQGFTLIALPMKIAGGSGGPLRIVALLHTTEEAP